MTQDGSPRSPLGVAPAPVRRARVMQCFSQYGWPCTVALLWVYMVLINVPWLPELPRAELDFAWGWALQWARLSGADFGRDIAFTYGPWGFITQGYHPQTHAISMLICVFITSATFFALVRLTTQTIRRRWIAAMLVFLLITLGGGRSIGHWEVRLLILPWSVLLIHFCAPARSQRWDLPALSATLALVSQIKFTLLLVSLVVLLAITVDQLIRRKIPYEIIAFGTAFLAFWELAGQRLGSLALYLQHSWWIAGGYAQGAALYASSEARDVTQYGLVAAAILATVVAAQWRVIRCAGASFSSPASERSRRRLGILGPAAVSALSLIGAVGALLLLLFKSGFVRHDEHELIARVGAGALSILVAVAFWPALSNGILRTAACGVVAGALGLMWTSENRWMSSGLPGVMLSTLTDIPPRAAAAGASLIGRDPNVALYKAHVSAARDGRRIPDLTGSADVYSYTQISLISSGHEYRPRPLIQSYLAYTTALGQLDAEFLRGSRAPDSILFGIQLIDDHLASEEDAASWPELLTRYDLADGTCSHLLLKHSPSPRTYRLVPLLSSQMNMDQSLRLPPSDGPIWARIRLRSTLSGRMRQTLYKNPPLILRLRQRDGMIHAYHLLPDVAAGGFLLSPVISDPSQFMMLYGTGMMDQLGDETVVELQVGGENPASLDGIFDPRYSIELFRLEYPTRDISGVPGVSDYLQLRNTLHSATTVYSDAPLGIYTMDPGIHAIVAVRRSQILLPIPAGTGAVQIPLGIVRQGDAGGEPSGGCEMKIYAVQRDGRGGFNGQLLISRNFAPQHILADSAPVTVTAQLPPGQLDGILLETSPTRAGATVVSYWGLPLFIPNEKKSPQRE